MHFGWLHPCWFRLNRITAIPTLLPNLISIWSATFKIFAYSQLYCAYKSVDMTRKFRFTSVIYTPLCRERMLCCLPSQCQGSIMESPTFACTAVGKIYPVIIRLSGSCRWGSEVVSCPLSCTLLHPYPTADPSLCCTTNSYCKPTPYLVRLLLCSVSLDGAYYVSICSKGLDCNCTCHAGPCKFLASNARLLY